MAQIKVHYRFVLLTVACLLVLGFIFASPANMTSLQKPAKSAKADSGKQLVDDDVVSNYPPKVNGDAPAAPVGGNSPQYADDSANAAAPAAADGKKDTPKVDLGTAPQFSNDNAKDIQNSKEKQADKDSLAEAPNVQDKVANKGGFAAIKGSDKAYEGVPDDQAADAEFDDGEEKTGSSTGKKASTGKSAAGSTEDDDDSVAVADCKKDPEYVVMIDAGSTGSRIHVYEFDVCYSPPKLNKESFEMLKPGLSSFDTDTKSAAASLDPLLKVALETVPKAKQGCTPVAVKATAGLRLLGEEKSANILNAVRKHLEDDYPFAVVEGDGISIMSGDDEGVYAWITTNYLLGNIGSKEKTPTAAVFDLGGGSTQIVFEPEFKNGEKMAPGEHVYELNFGSRDFTLYQFSHLGFGLMQGRNKINSIIVETALKNGKLTKNSAAAQDLESPCIPPGLTAKDVSVKISTGETYKINFVGSSTPAGSQCRFLAESILNKEAECSQEPCSFNGVHQPSLVKTFKESSDLFIFSYFYDRTNPLGMPSSFTLRELTELASTVCNGESIWAQALSSIDGSIKELQDEPQWCLDLSFQVALLHTGYDIPLNRELRTAKKIANNELGWCLGASLPLLEKKNWQCRVKQVE